MSIHGTLDDSRPYEGIENYYLSIDEMHEYWININKTNPVPVVSDFESDGQPVEYYSFKNGINKKIINAKLLVQIHDELLLEIYVVL